MKNWQKLALLAAAAAATAGTGGAAAPALAAGSGTAGAAAGTGAAGGLLGAGTAGAGAAGTAATGTGLLSAAHPLIATGETGLLAPSATGGIGGLSAGTFNPAAFGAGATNVPAGITGADIMGGLKGAGQAASSAAAINNLFPHAQQPANMSQGNPAGPQTVAQLYQSSQQAVQDQINQAAQERMQRRKIWG